MNLMWTPGLPVCEPLACADPPLVENAVAVASGHAYLDTASYTCNPGYELRVSNQTKKITIS